MLESNQYSGGEPFLDFSLMKIFSKRKTKVNHDIHPEHELFLFFLIIGKFKTLLGNLSNIFYRGILGWWHFHVWTVTWGWSLEKHEEVPSFLQKLEEKPISLLVLDQTYHSSVRYPRHNQDRVWHLQSCQETEPETLHLARRDKLLHPYSKSAQTRPRKTTEFPQSLTNL